MGYKTYITMVQLLYGKNIFCTYPSLLESLGQGHKPGANRVKDLRQEP